MEEKDKVYEGFKESILERERLGTTSLESGAAIPHASPETVKESRIAIMTLRKFIRWDNKYVNTIILICIANKDMHKVKSILSEIYQIVETKDTISHLLVGKKEKEIIELLGGAASD
ncbi:Heat-responsive suppressor HrsA [compost metagenome]